MVIGRFAAAEMVTLEVNSRWWRALADDGGGRRTHRCLHFGHPTSGQLGNTSPMEGGQSEADLIALNTKCPFLL